jgi:hypothetical protein
MEQIMAHIWIYWSYYIVSILNVELYENRGDEGILAKTDTITGFFTVDCDAEEFECQAGIGDLVLLQEPGLNINYRCGIVFDIHHRDVVDLQRPQNAIAEEIEVEVGQ